MLTGSFVLASCTTIATGVTSHPPGIHPGSFRECLLDNGFFTPTALAGTSKRDFEDKHVEDKGATKSRKDIMGLPGPEFTALTARIMRNDLMPHLQYGGETANGDLLNPSLNRPYAENIEGPGYAEGGFSRRTAPDTGGDKALAEIAVNRYLDCYLGPVGHESQSDALNAGKLAANDGDDDIEGRMLRAHILLTLAANYGAELLSSRPSANLASRAERLLTHVRDAEEAIRLSSPVMNSAMRATFADAGLASMDNKTGILKMPEKASTTSQISLRWHDTATRILRVFQVAADIEMIDARQSLDRAKNLLAAFNQPSTLLFEGVLKDALKGFGTIQKVRLFGDAMLRDARESLAVHRRRLCTAGGSCSGEFVYSLPPAGTQAEGVDERMWLLWDRELARACTVIASAAKKDDASCIPDNDQVAKMWAAQVRK